jgi:hypothetical protein
MQCSESHDYMSMHLHCSCRRGTGDGEAAAAAGDGAPAQEKHGKSTSERVGRTRRPLPRRRPPPPSRPRRPRMRAIWPVAGKQACGRARARAASEPPGHAMQASWLRSGAAGRHLEVKELVAQQLAAVLPGSVCRPRPDACDRARECFWRMDDRAKQVIETQHSSIRMGNREWSGRRRRHLGERGGGHSDLVVFSGSDTTTSAERDDALLGFCVRSLDPRCAARFRHLKPSPAFACRPARAVVVRPVTASGAAARRVWCSSLASGALSASRSRRMTMGQGEVGKLLGTSGFGPSWMCSVL